MKIYVIINGIEVTINAKPTDTIRKLAEIALIKTEDYPRPNKPVYDWIIVGEHQMLHMDKTLKEQKSMLKNGNIIFMTIKAGEGA